MRQSRIPGGAYVGESASGRQRRIPGNGFVNSYSAAVVMDFSGATVISGAFTTIGSSTLTINMNNSTMSVGTNFDLTGCTEFNSGASIITFNTAAAGNITSNGKSLYGVVFGKTSTNNATLIDDMVCNYVSSASNCRLLINSRTLTLVNNFTMVGTWGATGTIVMLGDGTLSSPAGTTFNVSSCTLDVRGNNTVSVYNATEGAAKFLHLKAAQDGKTTIWSGEYNYAGAILLTLGGGTFQLNKIFNLLPIATSSPIVLTSTAPTISGAYPFSLEQQWLGGSVVQISTLPALNFTNTGASGSGVYTNYAFVYTSINNGSGLVFSGNISSTNGHIGFYSATGGTTKTVVINDGVTINAPTKQFNVFQRYDSGNGAIDLRFGHSTGTGTVLNCASLTYSHAGIPGTPATYLVNYRAATINCSGSWTQDAYLTVTVGTATINMTGTGTTTGASKNWPTLVLGTLNTAYTRTWADGGCTIARLQIKARTTVALKDGTNYTVTNYTDGDWDGNATYKTILRSTTPSTRWNLINTSWT